MDYATTSLMVQVAKNVCGIRNPTLVMTDSEIREVCREIAESAPDTVWVDDKPTLGRIGIGIMLFITLTEFPEFYERHELAQVQ